MKINLILFCLVTASLMFVTDVCSTEGNRASEHSSGVLSLEARVDDWHSWLSNVIATPFDRIDRFFGDDVLLDETRRTRLRTGVGVRYDADDGGKMLTDFSLRVALPRLEERWQIFLDELAGEDELSGIGDLARPPVDTEPDVGLRYFLFHRLNRSVSADAGYRFGSPNQAFGRLRGRIRYPHERWSLELTQAVTYFTADGWRSQSGMAWTLPFASVYGFRISSGVKIEDKSPGFTPEQRFSLYRRLTLRRAWRLEGRGIWHELPDPSDIVYTVEFTYRQMIHRNWLFVEMVPGIEFAEVNDYSENPFIVLKFEIVFNGD